MNIRLESDDKKSIYDFLERHVKENKNQDYKIVDFGEFEKNGKKWTKCEIHNLSIL